MQRFEFLGQPLLGELAMSPERKKEREREKKMPFVVATYVYASSQGQRTHSARTNTKRPGFGLGFCQALGLAKSNTEEILKLVIKIHLKRNFCRLI